MDLIATNTQKYDIGRAAIFKAPHWDASFDLFGIAGFNAADAHIGNTEGAVEPEPNSEYSVLTLPETSGPANIKRYLSGDAPTFDLGIFPTPANMAVFSPTGKGSTGQSRRRLVREYTLWIVPEELFLAPDANGNVVEVPVTYSGGTWLKDGSALTTEEQRLLDISIIAWRCDFSRAIPVFRHEDGGKSLKQVTVNMQQDFDKPEGCQLYLMVSEAADFDVDFEGIYS